MNTMVDVHAHILPGIDDGAADWEGALEMARMAVSSGVDTLVCTPHTNIPGMYENYKSEKLEDLFRSFERKLMKENIPLKVLRGSEIYASLDMQYRIDRGDILPLNGTDCYLVEFGFDQEPDFMREVLYGMRRCGIRPLLAHPERYDCVQAFPALVYEWMMDGIYIQVNRASFFGRFGPEAEETVWRLLEHRLITCIASDAHSPKRRTTYMQDIYQLLKNEFSEDTAQRLLDIQPRMLVTGRHPRHTDLIPFSGGRWGRQPAF